MYSPSPRLQKQIETAFTYHPPKDDQAERYTRIREACKSLAGLIATNTPECREQSTALKKLEEVSMMANAAIARNE